MMKNASIKTKLFLSFGFVFLLMAALGAISIFLIETQTANARSIYENNLKVVELTWNISLSFAKLENRLNALIETTSANESDRLRGELINTLDIIDQDLKEMQPRLETDTGRSLRESISFNSAKIRMEILNLVELKKAKKQKDGIALFVSAIRPILINNETLTKDLLKSAQNQARLHYEELIKARKNAITITIALNAAAIIACAIIAVLMSLSITRPIQRLVQNLHRAAAGDFQDITLEEKRKDEIGQLITSFGTFLSDFKEQLAAINQAVMHLATSSNEISATSAQLSSSASETAASITETASTVEEIRQVAKSTKDLAHNASEAVSQTDEIRKEGIASLQAMSESIERIREQMEKIAQSILNLSEQSQAISEIISAVDDIAEQSNLLAVNAAIEAAKAGEQGKGFSVVAQEVKSLADQSKQSTRQVRKILSDIQKATSNAIMATEQGNKEVVLGVEKSRLVNAAIESLSNSIQGSNQLTQQITYANEQQLTGIEQINMAIENIKIASRQNVDSARSLEQAVNAIKDLSGNLKSMIERYQV